MSTAKSDKSKQFSILINDELKSSIDEENDEDDENSNEKPLLDRNEKSSSKKKSVNMKKGYYELSKQDRENVNELFESSNSKIVNAVDYDDDDEFEESDDDYKDEETNEQTQLTRQKKTGRHSEKKSIRKKLFGSSRKPNLSKQSSTDDELSLGKIKILIPRRKNKSKLIRYKIRKCMRNFVSLCFLFSALVVVFIMLYFKRQYLNQFVKDHLSSPSSSVKRTLEAQSKHYCDMLIVNNLWNKSLPELIVGNEFRLLDVNMDDTLDVLLPFGTSIDQAKYNPVLCQMYFNQTDLTDDLVGCGGGVLLLDGQTGDEIWRMYSKHQLNSINCFLDLDGDNINDCFATGPRAQFYTISGRTGRIIWKLNAQLQGEPIQPNAGFHPPLLLPKDIDGDGLNDLIVMHGGDYQRKTKSASARMICLSSRMGSILLWSHVPDGQDSYIPPVLFYRNQNKDLDTVEIIYGTGSFNTPGSLWSINLDEFLRKNTLKNSMKIYSDCCKGLLTPPILIDLNKDHIQDIVIAFNSTVAAFNGRTFVELWHTKFPTNTEFHIPPSVGYFDGDDVPDFIVQYELGDGFPNSYYSEVQALNGRNGKAMLKDSFKMLTGSRSSPITVSVDTKDGKSNKPANTTNDRTIDSFDLFLFSQTTCDKQEQELKKLTNRDQLDQQRFKLKFNSISELRTTDFCQLRFNKNSVNRINSVSYGNIMTTIYDSDDRAAKEFEKNNRFNWTKIGADYLSKNPDLFLNYMNNFDQENGYLNEDGDDLRPFEFMNDKRNRNDQDQSSGSSSFNMNNGFYLPGLNDKPDYSSFKRPNDYPSFNQQDKGAFSLPNQPILRDLSPNDNPFTQTNLANLLNQFQQQQQQQQPKLPPPYLNQGFDLNNLNDMNNRNRFVKKKSSPFDDLPTLEEIFQRRRSKRSTSDEAKFTHKIYSTATLAPSKLENGIDLVFGTSWIPMNKNVKLIKKSDYDDCIRTAQKNKDGQAFAKSSSLNEFVSYCDKQLNKNEETGKKPIVDTLLRKQMGSSTIYRNSLKCKNQDFHMRPYRYQIWPSYMGILGNGMANV